MCCSVLASFGRVDLSSSIMRMPIALVECIGDRGNVPVLKCMGVPAVHAMFVSLSSIVRVPYSGRE